MTKAISYLLFFAIVPALAGCSDPSTDSDPGPEIPDSNPPSPPSKEDPPLPDAPTNNTTNSQRIVLSQCTGFLSSTTPYPRPLGPGQAPPGWEPENPTVLASWVVVVGYECQRMHVGSYERGPVRMVWDGHDNVDTPPKCSEGRPARYLSMVLNAILVNDLEIATYLKDEYGLPAHYTDIGVTTEEIGAVKQHTWSWGPESTKSQLIFPDDGTSVPFDGGERLFWQRDEGIGMLELSYSRQAFQFTERPGEGSMQSPMILSEEETNEYVGPTNRFSEISGKGEIKLFEDLFCEQPVSRP